ncbi:hypothetical protein PsYK624_161370 [Phanerochaete sordida]|uniref:Uncharacterized protein n=1 Tax=Phanerochaete sordida TaxID=48140 RepID=A0A9P3GRQ9_9APHY|nr:hypothetical protein PsYK624_161370 [Phanerochaete sordida]
MHMVSQHSAAVTPNFYDRRITYTSILSRQPRLIPRITSEKRNNSGCVGTIADRGAMADSEGHPPPRSQARAPLIQLYYPARHPSPVFSGSLVTPHPDETSSLLTIASLLPAPD